MMECPKCGLMILEASRNYHCHPSTGRVYGVICVHCKATVFLKTDGTVEVIQHRNRDHGEENP